MLLVSLAALMGAASVTEGAQDTQATAEPPPATEAPAEDASPKETPADGKESDAKEVEEVVVTGTRAEVVQRIDREVYDISKDPTAQANPMIDVLGKLPSVIVTPDGRVRLLGQTGVTVQIDGKRPPNLEAALRGLMGSDVERVEVSTNPSAASRPDGSAGLINIITRKDRRKQGLSGMVSASVDSFGGVNLSVSPSLTRGRWTLQSSFGLNSFAGDSGGEVVRRFLDPNGDVILEEVERAEREMRSESASGRVRIGFKPTETQSLGLTLDGFYADNGNPGRTRFSASDPGYDPYVEIGTSEGSFHSLALGLDYERTGPVEGEKLNAAVNLSVFNWLSDDLNRLDYDDPSLPDPRYLFGYDSHNRELSAKLDYVRPFGETRLLSTGLLWERDQRKEAQSFADLGGTGGLGPDYRSVVSGYRHTAAAYGTWQFVWGKWTVLPGLRGEEERLYVRAGGIEAERSNVDWFPSLHLKRDLTKTLNLNLSYARRISRPEISQFSPEIRYFSSNDATTGNPDLRNTVTHSSEAKLGWKWGRQDIMVTLYDRRSEDVVEWVTDLLPDGVRLNRPVNAGELVNQGAELSLRGPLGEQWKYSLTGNLYARESEVLVGGVLRSQDEVTYSGNGSIEWRSKASDPEMADQVSLSVQYFGPRRDFQGESDGRAWADLTWRHPVTKKVAATLTVSDLFDSQDFESLIRTDEFEEERRWEGQGTRVRLGLSYRLGGK